MRYARGFTLVDLGVTVFLVLLVFVVFVPACSQNSRRASPRIKCSSNLRQIGLAMKMYANEEIRTNAYPRTIYEDRAPPVAWTNPDSPHPFKEPNPPGPNDVTAAPFLNLRTQDITTDVFICPSSDADRFQFAEGKTIQAYSNFHNQTELSYSFQNPYATSAAVKKGFVYNDSMDANFAIAADINPGVKELLTTPFGATQTDIRKLNSPNHDYDGQNVLYADGHVDWYVSPFAGIKNDNIYTHGPNPPEAHPDSLADPIGINGSPADASDSILLPAWDPAFPMPVRPAGIAFKVVALIATLIVLTVGLIVFVFVSRSTRKVPEAIA